MTDTGPVVRLVQPVIDPADQVAVGNISNEQVQAVCKLVEMAVSQAMGWHRAGGYRTNACQNCAIKHSCTTAKERLISRWEHEHILEAVQRRLDEHPEKMRQRRETVEHPFGTIKARMGATHFLMKTLPRVASEMALHVLAYNLTRVMNIMGVKPLMAAMRA